MKAYKTDEHMEKHHNAEHETMHKAKLFHAQRNSLTLLLTLSVFDGFSYLPFFGTNTLTVGA